MGLRKLGRTEVKKLLAKRPLGYQRAKNNEVILSINDATIIDYLEELAERFGIEIRYEVIRQDEDLSSAAGGLCLLKGKYVLINN